MFTPLRNLVTGMRQDSTEKSAGEAYDLWASSYDRQPGNLMLDLDELICSALLDGLQVEGRVVADIGCGTGRHWPKIWSKRPASLTGFDISEKMLEQLERKFPGSMTRKIDDNLFSDEPAGYYDLLISTLTVAHICNLAEAFAGWARILKPRGELIITDFHPELLKRGGKRTFTAGGRQVSVLNWVHPIEEVISLLQHLGFHLEMTVERQIDEQVRHYYENKKALRIFEKFRGSPVIYGMHWRKS
ncbi:MAG TPA: class I SAM-dependent methyltransferase [Puia sp.]|nr:class I SAM-dependent methyltransferase [Puia sp.]